MAKKFKTWNEYVKDAQKPPFEIPVDDERTILIQAPTGKQLAQAQRLAKQDEDIEEQLRVMCGDAADEVLPLVMDAPGEVIGVLVRDIMAHFGYESGEVLTRT